MGLGDYMSSQAEVEYTESERNREKWEMENNMGQTTRARPDTQMAMQAGRQAQVGLGDGRICMEEYPCRLEVSGNGRIFQWLTHVDCCVLSSACICALLSEGEIQEMIDREHNTKHSFLRTLKAGRSGSHFTEQALTIVAFSVPLSSCLPSSFFRSVYFEGRE